MTIFGKKYANSLILCSVFLSTAACTVEEASDSSSNDNPVGGELSPGLEAPGEPTYGSDVAAMEELEAAPIISNGDASVAPGATADGSPAPGGSVAGGDVNGIQYFGRWDFSDPANPTASWGAVYLTARFTGTSVTLKMQDGNNDFQYRIDGGEMTYYSPGSEGEHVLANGLAEGEHTLEFYRRSGGSFGRTTVSGLILDPGAEVIPTERPVRKVEVLGDSISVGYGNEGMNSTSRSTENGYEAYGPQFARMVGAQWSVVAHSGQGMVRNLGEQKDSIPTGTHMSDEFKMTHYPSAGTNPDWDFSSWQPDVLIVTLGTNDFSWPQWDMDPGPAYELTEEEYVGGYQEFLSFARSVYPEAQIFAVGTFISNSTNQFGRC
ncbi:MAG: GDSL-type esterase/lipase family protein, partial [Polyangiaceae bacterium]|nr:GDSL-type esterase/lipase family protein [Polyangiaceae bacterium]